MPALLFIYSEREKIIMENYNTDDSAFSTENISVIEQANIKKEKKILNISLSGSILFLVAEIICAFATGSMAILMDCVYDIAQLVMIGPFLILVPLLYKPVTEKRPYGYAQVESLFILIKYLMLLVIEGVLIIGSVKTILEGGNEVESNILAIFELGVSLTCIIMFFTLKHFAKKFSSPAVKAELFIWRLDSLSTFSVGIGFLVNSLIGKTAISWICPYVDPAIAIIIAVVLAKEPIEMIIESIRNLVLFAPEKEILDRIESVCRGKCMLYDTEVTFVDVIKTGRTYWIEVYFDTHKDYIDVAKLKALDLDLEKTLADEFEDVWLELIPDVEQFRGVEPAKLPSRRQDRVAYIESKEKKKTEKRIKGTHI